MPNDHDLCRNYLTALMVEVRTKTTVRERKRVGVLPMGRNEYEVHGLPGFKRPFYAAGMECAWQVRAEAWSEWLSREDRLQTTLSPAGVRCMRSLFGYDAERWVLPSEVPVLSREDSEASAYAGWDEIFAAGMLSQITDTFGAPEQNYGLSRRGERELERVLHHE